MPQVQLAKPGGGFELRELSDAEYAKHSGSAGFLSANQGPTSGIKNVTATSAGSNLGSTTPGTGSQVNPPLTIDTPVTAPQYGTSLTGDDKAMFDSELESRLATARQISQQRQQEIKQVGKVKTGTTKGFLAKAGALGRTVSGATAESGIGVLGDIANKITEAIYEEQNRLSSEEASIRTDIRKASEERLDKLNALKQQTFNDALAIMNNSRAERADARAAAQEGRLDRAEQRDIESKARQETIDTLNFLLTNFGTEVIGKMTTADLNEWETDLGMPDGSLLEGFKLVEEEKKNNPEILSSQFFTDSMTGNVAVGILYKNGTTKNVLVGTGIGDRFKATGTGDTTDKEEKAFYDDIDKAADDLKSGATWAQVFNKIKARYGVDDEIIDKLLDKDTWSKEGAYQNFKNSTNSSTNTKEDSKTSLWNNVTTKK